MTNPGEVITPNSVKSYKHKGLIKVLFVYNNNNICYYY